MSIVWNFGPAAERARLNLKLKKNKKKQEAASHKPQASSAVKGTQLKSRIKT